MSRLKTEIMSDGQDQVCPLMLFTIKNDKSLKKQIQYKLNLNYRSNYTQQPEEQGFFLAFGQIAVGQCSTSIITPLIETSVM